MVAISKRLLNQRAGAPTGSVSGSVYAISKRLLNRRAVAPPETVSGTVYAIGVSAAQMREMDRRAREEFGIPELILMEHAGHAVAKAARRMVARRRAGAVVVLSGSGANGGDGFVAARHLDNWGIPVEVVVVGDLAHVRGAAEVNLGILRRLGVPVHAVSSVRGWRAWASRARRPAVLVDALLGTGVMGQVRQPVRAAIGWINRQPGRVVSVDLPSGLSAETGAPCGAAVRADLTVTCGLPKRGLRGAEGRRWAGRVEVADISLPRALKACKS